jgi:centromere protein S
MLFTTYFDPYMVILQKLKVAVHYTVGKLCEFREQQGPMKLSAYFIAALADLAYKQAEAVAGDLEFFAKHAKRTINQIDDVKLCARRNPGLVSHI